MKFTFRVKDEKRKAELQKMYFLLAAYPIFLIISIAIAFTYSMTIGILVYSVFLVVVTLKIFSIAKLDFDF